MEELKKRTLGAGIGILTLFQYFSDFIPPGLKSVFALLGFTLALGYISTPTLMVLPNTFVKKMYCKTCKDVQRLTGEHANEVQRLTEEHAAEIKILKDNTPEKNVIFENYEKVLIIDHKGYSWTNLIFEIYNNGKDPVQHFPFEFSSCHATFKSLKEYQRDKEFIIESRDGHSLKWECVHDDEHHKEVMITFDQKILPGERRKYSIRYQIPGMYRCTASSADVGDWSSWKPLHLYKNIYEKVLFLPKYPYSHPRYCVTTPGGDLMNTKCVDLTTHEDSSGRRYVEVRETWPWMYHMYRIEWDLPRQ